MTDRVEIAAPAKVNLRLCILAREESGYHALETVFCAISLGDTIAIQRGDPGIRLAVEGGVDTGPPARNLAVRAAELFHRELGEAAAINIHLAKRIPSQAGLGGGSSDAAAVLRALNALHGDPLPRGALLQMAIGLGADVPFFLCGSPLALAWGRGERLMALPGLPVRPVLVAKPGWSMPTADAFGEIARLRGGAYHPRSVLLGAADVRSWAGVESMAVNEFELAMGPHTDDVRALVEAMRSAGARIALLAGSGSSVFGVFENQADRDAAEEVVRAASLSGELQTWRAETLGRMPEPVVG
ncbi:MAG TPA: 4-(cytidine 5'-diphospho)-2-C-methyl-D-erythritol kinase [Longimicrobium sp.]|nr:4-(cytidine 5'-diphospho)-2-C-methyl-D-erythritol kinase [Longimicrobium sp.]